MALSGAVVFGVVFLGVFAILISVMALTPYVTLHLPASATSQLEIVTKEMNATGLLSYSNAGYDFINATGYTTTATVNTGLSSPPQWTSGMPQGQILEIWYGDESTPVLSLLNPFFELRQTQINTYPIFGGYYFKELSRLTFYNASGRINSYGLSKTDLTGNWDAEANATKLTARNNQLAVSVVIQPLWNNETIAQAATNHRLQYYLSYGVNATQTGIGLFSIVSQILTFQSPTLGIPGIGGVIVDDVIALFVWSVLGYLIYKLLAGLVPWLSGGSGD
jgi:hypothetical protein